MRGTIRHNRGVPLQLRELNISKYGFAYMRKGDVLMVKFHDKKIVYLVLIVDTAGDVAKTRILHGQI